MQKGPCVPRLHVPQPHIGRRLQQACVCFVQGEGRPQQLDAARWQPWPGPAAAGLEAAANRGGPAPSSEAAMKQGQPAKVGPAACVRTLLSLGACRVLCSGAGRQHAAGGPCQVVSPPLPRQTCSRLSLRCMLRICRPASVLTPGGLSRSDGQRPQLGSGHPQHQPLTRLAPPSPGAPPCRSCTRCTSRKRLVSATCMRVQPWRAWQT